MPGPYPVAEPTELAVDDDAFPEPFLFYHPHGVVILECTERDAGHPKWPASASSLAASPVSDLTCVATPSQTFVVATSSLLKAAAPGEDAGGLPPSSLAALGAARLPVAAPALWVGFSPCGGGLAVATAGAVEVFAVGDLPVGATAASGIANSPLKGVAGQGAGPSPACTLRAPAGATLASALWAPGLKPVAEEPGRVLAVTAGGELLAGELCDGAGVLAPVAGAPEGIAAAAASPAPGDARVAVTSAGAVVVGAVEGAAWRGGVRVALPPAQLDELDGRHHASGVQWPLPGCVLVEMRAEGEGGEVDVVALCWGAGEAGPQPAMGAGGLAGVGSVAPVFPPLAPSAVARGGPGPHLACAGVPAWGVALTAHRWSNDNHVSAALLAGGGAVAADVVENFELRVPFDKSLGDEGDNLVGGLAVSLVQPPLGLQDVPDPEDPQARPPLPPSPVAVVATTDGRLRVFSLACLDRSRYRGEGAERLLRSPVALGSLPVAASLALAPAPAPAPAADEELAAAAGAGLPGSGSDSDFLASDDDEPVSPATPAQGRVADGVSGLGAAALEMNTSPLFGSAVKTAGGGPFGGGFGGLGGAADPKPPAPAGGGLFGGLGGAADPKPPAPAPSAAGGFGGFNFAGAGQPPAPPTAAAPPAVPAFALAETPAKTRPSAAAAHPGGVAPGGMGEHPSPVAAKANPLWAERAERTPAARAPGEAEAMIRAMDEDQLVKLLSSAGLLDRLAERVASKLSLSPSPAPAGLSPAPSPLAPGEGGQSTPSPAAGKQLAAPAAGARASPARSPGRAQAARWELPTGAAAPGPLSVAPRAAPEPELPESSASAAVERDLLKCVADVARMAGECEGIERTLRQAGGPAPTVDTAFARALTMGGVGALADAVGLLADRSGAVAAGWRGLRKKRDRITAMIGEAEKRLDALGGVVLDLAGGGEEAEARLSEREAHQQWEVRRRLARVRDTLRTVNRQLPMARDLARQCQQPGAAAGAPAAGDDIPGDLPERLGRVLKRLSAVEQGLRNAPSRAMQRPSKPAAARPAGARGRAADPSPPGAAVGGALTPAPAHTVAMRSPWRGQGSETVRKALLRVAVDAEGAPRFYAVSPWGLQGDGPGGAEEAAAELAPPAPAPPAPPPAPASPPALKAPPTPSTPGTPAGALFTMPPAPATAAGAAEPPKAGGAFGLGEPPGPTADENGGAEKPRASGGMPPMPSAADMSKLSVFDGKATAKPAAAPVAEPAPPSTGSGFNLGGLLAPAPKAEVGGGAGGGGLSFGGAAFGSLGSAAPTKDGGSLFGGAAGGLFGGAAAGLFGAKAEAKKETEEKKGAEKPKASGGMPPMPSAADMSKLAVFDKAGAAKEAEKPKASGGMPPMPSAADMSKLAVFDKEGAGGPKKTAGGAVPPVPTAGDQAKLGAVFGGVAIGGGAGTPSAKEEGAAKEPKPAAGGPPPVPTAGDQAKLAGAFGGFGVAEKKEATAPEKEEGGAAKEKGGGSKAEDKPATTSSAGGLFGGLSLGGPTGAAGGALSGPSGSAAPSPFGGGASAQPSQTSGFGALGGAPAEPAKPASSVFGAPAASAAPAAAGGFGSATVAAAPTSSGFGGASGGPALGGAFGQPSQPASGFGQAAQPASAFGQPSQPASAFGQPSQPASGFGQPTQPASGFGQAAQPASAFGQPSQPASGFGQPSSPAPAAGGFGTAAGSAASPAGGGFAALASNTGGGGGFAALSASGGMAGGFGNKSAFGSTNVGGASAGGFGNASAFGSTNVGGGSGGGGSSGGFGNAAAFGGASTGGFGNASAFGSTNVGGSGGGSTGGFGNASAFGSTNVGGNGSAAPSGGFGSGFGNPSAFGSASGFGGTSAGGGASTGGFGSGFGAGTQQGGGGFGSGTQQGGGGFGGGQQGGGGFSSFGGGGPSVNPGGGSMWQARK